jgi:hypothetical protein
MKEGYSLGLLCHEKHIWPCELNGPVTDPIPIDNYLFMQAWVIEHDARIETHNEIERGRAEHG